MVAGIALGRWLVAGAVAASACTSSSGMTSTADADQVARGVAPFST
ncbi:MAG: hypothetical protein M3O50_11275 [Myxococcota bacterium]|nr:hypothetical protein [Myxococcota bacterium]